MRPFPAAPGPALSQRLFSARCLWGGPTSPEFFEQLPSAPCGTKRFNWSTEFAGRIGL